MKAFLPETFWYIFLSVIRTNKPKDLEINFTWRRGHIFDFEHAAALYETVLEHQFARVTKVTKKETKKWYVRGFIIFDLGLDVFFPGNLFL